MKIEGWFYLRKDGVLVFTAEKPGGVRGAILSMLVESQVVTFWPWTRRDRGSVWRILVEGLAGGADRDQIGALAARAGCDDRDALVYAQRIGCMVSREGAYWKATRADYEPGKPAGYGAHVLDAMADLCKQLGYQPSKILQQEFTKLLKTREGK